ncbi:MAG: branched-chain amino acid ABC transporter permease [Mycobacteriaceae bacterium]
MTKFVELMIQGVSLGFIYALIALGFVVIFKATEVVNFAHGSLLLLGGYVVGINHQRFGFWLALLFGVAAAALGALLIEVVLIRRLRGRDTNSLAILTIGVDIIMLTELTRRIGSQVLSTGDPWGSKLVTVAGFTVPQSRIAAIVVAIVLMSLFFTAYKFSSWGVATRAAAEDSEAAALMGIRLGRVSMLSWVIAGALAAIAAIFLVAFPTPGLTNTTGLIAFRAFPAAILGGLDSTAGALLGGIVVGLAETLTSGYEDKMPFLGGGFGSIMPYIVMILVLLWRPSGLLGTKDIARV